MVTRLPGGQNSSPLPTALLGMGGLQGGGWGVMEGEKRVPPPNPNLAIHLLLRCRCHPTEQ